MIAKFGQRRTLCGNVTGQIVSGQVLGFPKMIVAFGFAYGAGIPPVGPGLCDCGDSVRDCDVK